MSSGEFPTLTEEYDLKEEVFSHIDAHWYLWFQKKGSKLSHTVVRLYDVFKWVFTLRFLLFHKSIRSYVDVIEVQEYYRAQIVMFSVESSTLRRI